MQPIQTIDARGLGCPKPVILAEEALAKMEEGIVEVLVDNEASVRNLSRFAGNNALYSETDRLDGHWRVRLVKGYSCGTTGAFPSVLEAPVAQAKGIMLVVGTDALGKDEELGRKLMKGFFETMRVTGELPHTIFFLNAGVRLTTIEEEIVPVLKEMENKGVEVYSCGTCLDYYGLADALKVGNRGSTSQIVEGMKDFEKLLWI